MKAKKKLTLPNVKNFIKDTESRNKLLQFADEVQEAAGVPDLKEYTRHGGKYSSAITASYLGEYNPDNISIETYEKMREDAQISFGLKIIKLPIKSLPFYIQCSDDVIKYTVTQALNRIWRSKMRSTLNGLDFGFAPHEKVWEAVKDISITDDEGNEIKRGTFWFWKKLKDLKPSSVKLLRDTDSDDFAGFKQDNVSETIPSEKAYVFTNEKEYGNLFGKSILKPSYDPWYWCTLIYQFCLRYFERRGTPTVKCKAPNKTFKINGQTDKNGLEYMQSLGESLANESVFTIPSEYDNAGNLMWDAEYMKSDARGEMFLRLMEHLQALKLRGIFVPERVATQDNSTGSYSMADSHADIMLLGLDGIIGDIEEHDNKYLIKQFKDYNFGINAPDAYVHIKRLSEENKTILKSIIEKVGRLESIPADWIKILEQLNIPVKQEETTQAEKKNSKSFHFEKGKGKFSRALNAREKSVDFEAIEDFLNKQQDNLIRATNDILVQQKELYLIQLKNILESTTTQAQKLRDIGILKVKYQGKYEDTIISNLTHIVEFNMKQAAKELKIKSAELTPEVKAWIKSIVITTVDKHMSELNAKITYPALDGINRKASNQEIIYDTQKAFEGFIAQRTVSLAENIVGKGLNRGRELARLQADNVVSAQWSAIMDGNTCKFCESRDGMIININDPDYYKYPAGEIHGGDRCIWIYILADEDPANRIEDWQSPPQYLVDQFMQ